jgi:transposase
MEIERIDTRKLEPAAREQLRKTDRQLLCGRALCTVQVAKRSELHTFAVIPKRWVVERSFAWLEKNRRLWKNCERWLNTSLQFIHLAFLAMLLRRS